MGSLSSDAGRPQISKLNGPPRQSGASSSEGTSPCRRSYPLRALSRWPADPPGTQSGGSAWTPPVTTERVGSCSWRYLPKGAATHAVNAQVLTMVESGAETRADGDEAWRSAEQSLGSELYRYDDA